MKDLYNVIQNYRAFAPAVVTASAQGPSVSIQFAEAAVFAIDIGTLGDTLSGSKSYEFRIQESQDGTTFADVTNTAYVQYSPVFLNTGTAADPAQSIKVGYLGYAPFVRLSVLVTGTMTTGTSISAQLIACHFRHQPAGVTPQVP